MRTLLVLSLSLLLAGTCRAEGIRGHLDTEHLPSYLHDRGEGIALSMFGTYIQKGQALVYPFVEFYRDKNYEYAPSDFGFPDGRDYRGEYEASEQLLFLAYGISDRLALEMEGAIIQAELERSSGDFSGLPLEMEQSGLGDVEGQLRWRWKAESAHGPGVFSYFETVVPTQDAGSLIGTTDWEFKLGTGLVRGFSFGTMTFRGAVEYDRGEDRVGIGEFAVEYLRRLSRSWRVYGGFEGNEDEWEFITEAQWHFSRKMFLKVNNGLGITSKATGWAPEVGMVFGW